MSDREQTFYQNYKDMLIVKPFIRSSSFEFVIQSEQTNRKIEYKPNLFGTYGVSLAYWILGFSISSKFDQAEKDPLTYGNSSYLDFQINYYGKKLGIDLNLGYYQGFYVKNSGDFSEGIVNGEKYFITQSCCKCHWFKRLLCL